MKTTIDIADGLFQDVRRIAERDGTTLRALVEEGLRRVASERAGARTFRLRPASFKGEGLQAPFARAGWDRIRDAAYEDHGA